MADLGDRALGSTVDLKFTTQVNGTPTALAGSPAISVYMSGTSTPITSGVTFTGSYNSTTGLNDVSIVASSGNGFNAGEDYDVVITTGTLGGISAVGTVVGHFSLNLGNIASINDVSASSVTTINANQGTTQPVNFTGTGSSAYIKSDMQDIAGSAVSASSAQIGVNLVNIAGSAVSTSSAQLGVNTVNIAGHAATLDGNNLLEVDVADIAGSAVSTSSAQLGVNLVNIAGSAVSTSTAQLGTNVVNIAGSGSAATDLSKTTNAIARGTVTTGASTTSVPTSAFTLVGSSASGVVANQFAGRTILFDGNTTTAGLCGAAAGISASSASNTPTLTVGTLPATPASGDTFSII